jgi:hypothetical protein
MGLKSKCAKAFDTKDVLSVVAIVKRKDHKVLVICVDDMPATTCR